MKFHCMNSVELILLKCIPRGHPNLCSSVGLSCSIFKNTSATCAYPLVSNARKLKRDKRAHACAQGTFSYTPCSRRGLTKNIRKHIFFVRHLLVHAMFEKGPYEKYMLFRKFIRLTKHMFFEKVYMFLKKVYMFFEKVCMFFKKYICFLKKYVCFLKKYIFFEKAYIFFVRLLLVHRSHLENVLKLVRSRDTDSRV